MQLTTIYFKIPVYDDILLISRDFWTNFKLSKTKSLHSRVYLLLSKVKYLKYLIKLFTSTVCKLTAFDLQDVKNGRFKRAVVYRVFICQKKYLRQLKACLLKSQLVEAWSIWIFIAWWKSVLLRGYRKWSKIVCSKTTIISIPKSNSNFL
jgi:hypothetical protein